jgi:maltooligosyltrehalose trehalohydrolase
MSTVDPDTRLGATVSATGVSFRVWAPTAESVRVEFPDPGIEPVGLTKSSSGYFFGHSPGAGHGTAYRYALDSRASYPDPYSRYQPQGPHGPSMAIDAARYEWTDHTWEGLDPSRQIVYELHVGTLTRTGTYDQAAEHLAHLRDLGITAIELLPVNEFVGKFGWGYDGVNLFAPFHHYGTPDELRRLVDRAHAHGLGVILDVVYNHFGFDGNYLDQFDSQYLDHAAENPWGGAPNFACDAMRRMVIDNAAYWIREFHIDGLRLDATQNIHDPDHPRLLASLVGAARAAAGSRSIVVSAEDYLQRTPLLASVRDGGPQMDQVWNDDFHHAARVALTGSHAGYFRDYRGRAQELVSALRHGYLFQGQYDGWKKGSRGTAVQAEPLWAFVVFTQNHDQLANTLFGQRLHLLTSPGKYRALTAALLLGPGTPLIFMGQEFSASTPFAYFADYAGDTARQVRNGRRRETLGFDPYADPAAQACLLDPCSYETVVRSTLDFSECARNEATLRLFRDLMWMRRKDAILNTRPLVRFDGATLTENAFALRWYAEDGSDRLLVVNLGAQIDRSAIPEPLLAAPAGHNWHVAWSSNDPAYGGLGTLIPDEGDGWQFDAESSIFFRAEPS